jgi:hypothetical protein
MKTVAGVGVVSGAAVALAIPAETADAETEGAPSVAAMALDDRMVDVASRASTRQAPEPAVSAPAGAAPMAPAPVGVDGVRPVAKPKPKPKPKPAPKAATTPGSTNTTVPAAGAWSGSLTGRCTSIGLIPNAARLCSAVDSAYGPPTIGGRRGTADEHGTGQAIDFMISGAAQGDAIAAYVQAHVGEFNVKYLIWQQRYWAPGQGWKFMADRGSPTANHYDHVHVTVNY